MISRKSKCTGQQRLRQGLIARIGRASQAFQRSTDAFDDLAATRLRINRTDLRCLDWLFDGPKTAGQLAAATGLSSAATTTLLDRLESRGLVRRVRDAADRRKVIVEMTEHGLSATAEYYGLLAEEGARMLEQYTEGQLTAIHNYLTAATELIDRQARRLRDRATQVTPLE